MSTKNQCLLGLNFQMVQLSHSSFKNWSNFVILHTKFSSLPYEIFKKKILYFPKLVEEITLFTVWLQYTTFHNWYIFFRSFQQYARSHNTQNPIKVIKIVEEMLIYLPIREIFKIEINESVLNSNKVIRRFWYCLIEFYEKKTTIYWSGYQTYYFFLLNNSNNKKNGTTYYIFWKLLDKT